MVQMMRYGRRVAGSNPDEVKMSNIISSFLVQAKQLQYMFISKMLVSLHSIHNMQLRFRCKIIIFIKLLQSRNVHIYI